MLKIARGSWVRVVAGERRGMEGVVLLTGRDSAVHGENRFCFLKLPDGSRLRTWTLHVERIDAKPPAHVNAVHLRAVQATSNTDRADQVEAWLWVWIYQHWELQEWRTLPPDDVAGQALHAWQHSHVNPSSYQQARLL